jgi:multidrug efflux pump subunit AcrB
MANPSMRFTDVAWSVLFVAIFILLIPVSIVGGAMLLVALHVPGTENNDLTGVAAVIFFIWIFVGIPLAWLLALWLCSQLTRRYLSQETHDRWVQQFENGIPNLTNSRVGSAYSWLGSYFLKATAPDHERRNHDV